MGKRKQVEPFTGKIVEGEPNDFMKKVTKYLYWRTDRPKRAGKSVEEVIQNIWSGFEIPGRDKITTATILISPKYRKGNRYNWTVGFGY